MLRRLLSPFTNLLALLFLGAAVLFLHRDLAFTDAVLGDYDLVAYFYPYRDFASRALREGRLPLWNPLIFGGAPFLANIQAAFFYPFHWLGLWLEAPRLVGLSLLFHYWLAGGALYAFCRRSLALGPVAAWFGGTVYMLSGFLAAQAGHPNQVAAAAWLPVLFLCFDEAVAHRSLPWAALGGLVVALQALSGHPQESYYSGVALGLFAAYRVLAPRRFLSFGELAPPVTGWAAHGSGLLRAAGRAVLAGGVLGLMGLLGAGLAAVQLLPSAQLTRYSIRASGLSYDLATIFSLPPGDILRAILPAYRDYAFGEHIAYLGVVPLLLAVLALLFRRDHPLVPFFGILAALALLLALGKHTSLYPLVFDYVPGAAWFRVPARWLMLFVFSVSVLAAVGLSSLALPRGVRLGGQATWVSLARTAVLGLVLAGGLGAATWAALVQDALPDAEILHRWAVFAALGTAVAVAGIRLRPARSLALALVALTLVELGLARQGLGYLRVFPPQVLSSLRPAQTVVLAGGPERVLSLAETDFPPGDLREVGQALERSLDSAGSAYALSLINLKEALSPNWSMTLGVPSLDGYDGGLLPLRIFAEMKGVLLESAARRAPPDPAWGGPQADRLLRLELPGIPDTRLLAALGVKYVIAGKEGDAWPDGVYFDLALVRPVSPGASLALQNLPEFETTSIGLMTFLEGGEDLPEGTPVARVTVVDGNETATERVLRVGADTAPGRSNGVPPHPAVTARWVGHSGGQSYLTWVRLGGARYPQRIQIQALTDRATLYVHGVSLHDERLGASQTIGLDPALGLIHVGDLKVYQNLDWVAPLYVASAATVLTDPVEAARALSTVAPDTVVLSRRPGDGSPALASAVPLAFRREPPAQARPVVAARPVPEVIQAEVDLVAPGFLVFSEARYPGWRAWVDGREAELLPANSLFQAVAVPAGRHRVELRYRSTVVELGWEISRLSLAFTLLLLAGPLLLGAILRAVRRHTAKTPPPTSGPEAR